jgi:phospholipid transport system substrate-binding protein
MMTYFLKRNPSLLALTIALCLTSFLASSAPASAGGSKADAGVVKFNATLLKAMKNADHLGYHGRYKLLEPVVKEVFALSFMGSKALGRHWKKLTPAQQGQYLKAYTAWTIANYAGNFDGYSGEKFEVYSTSSIDKETVAVKSSILKSTGESIADFKYLMRRISGKWQVVDIRIMEVSQLGLTRSQFVSVMNKSGFDSLIAMLREKTDAFAGKKGK